jgi:dihydrofolate synthase/folylpolyglutamate synthase
VTVAGTNGKGSSVALLTAIYRAAGYRVGTYSSPHLLHYRERIEIDGVYADDVSLCRAFARIEAARREIPLTYFEFGTLAALCLFREAAVELQVLEVGLGGRLDAVNIIDADAALITNIGLDHTDWLGPDRESIGGEKAGILRAGRPSVCVDSDPPASVLAAARALGSSMALLGHDFDYAVDGKLWSWRGRNGRIDQLPMPGLPGSIQLRNAAGVLAIIEALQPLRAVTVGAIKHGLPELRLSGRFERRADLLVDVAHNAEAAAVLAQNLKEAGLAGRVPLVLGMFADKPVEAVAAMLAPVVSRSYCAGLPPPRGLTGAQLAERAVTLRAEVCADVATALAKARRERGDTSVPILACGSFLTVAAALGTLDG